MSSAGIALVAVVVCVTLAVATADAAPALPVGVRCVAATAANEVAPPPARWEQRHEKRPAGLAPSLCSAGMVPTTAAGADSAPVVSSAPPVMAQPKRIGGVRPLIERGLEASAPYYYAGDGWSTGTPYQGMNVAIQVGDPALSGSAGGHSLGQIGVSSPSVEYSVELGWHVDKGFGEGPRIFTYINKDHYASNGQPGGDCYNCITPEVGAAYTQNELLTTGSTYEFGALYSEGRWWFSVNGSWIGYESGSFWGGSFTSSTWLSAWGEVYDSSGPYSQMGDGIRGNEAGSLTMGNPSLYEGGALHAVAGHATPAENEYPNDLPNYTVGLYSPDQRTWHYGGYATPRSPEATTDAASSVTEEQAQLNGGVNPRASDTHYYFQYGTTTSYGSAVPAPPGDDAGSGETTEPVAVTAAGLLSGTVYHYRLVASNGVETVYGADHTFTTEYEQSSSRWVDYNPATGETTVFYRNGSGLMAWWQWHPVKGWGSGVLGGPVVAAGTTPAVLYDATTGETSVFYQDSSGEIALWQWLPGRGWGSSATVLGGNMAAGTNPAAVIDYATGETTVYYQNVSGKIAYLQLHPGKGWEGGVLGGQAAAGTTPAVVYTPSTGETSVYYQNSEHQLAFWQRPPAKAWGSGTLGGHEAADSSPAVVEDQATGETTIYYDTSAEQVGYFQWHVGKGWGSGVLGGHTAANSTPVVVYTPSTGETTVYYQNSEHQLAFWQRPPAKAWGSGTLGGHEAANTSPAVVDDQATGAPTLYYQSSTGGIAWLQWQTGVGWGAGEL